MQYLAIASCRVSSDEQLLNNSLSRQRDAVIQAAKDLDVIIPEDGWWSGSVSSKRNTNVDRKDLHEMLDRCKKDKRIKYLIVDEPDRFMRSIDEAAYFEVSFRQLGVTVWYASDPDLNKGDLAAKLLKFTKYLSAEGSNEERQRKSIAGQTTALKEGRYPFSPKPGYKKGQKSGIQEIDEIKGPALRKVLLRVANRIVTPSQGLVELNNSDFTKHHSPIKMDKFRKMLTDPFYAGIVEISKQVQVRNVNGLHEPLISVAHYEELVDIMDKKKKNQAGPRKNGNDNFPLSNIVWCSKCLDQKTGRVVGLVLNNGKVYSKTYEKYRCRSCKRYMTKDELHHEVASQFKKKPITQTGMDDLLSALEKVWAENEDHSKAEVIRTQAKIGQLNDSIESQVEAAIDPSNHSIKKNILTSIEKKRDEVTELESLVRDLSRTKEDDAAYFLEFAFDFVKNMGDNFLDTKLVSRENRQRCKDLVFPAGFVVDENKKVYTPETSILFRLATQKRDTEVSQKSRLVRVQGL